MADLIPAMEVKFGRITYYVTYMDVNDIIGNVTFPESLEEWDNMSIEEKFQREINKSRVKKSIAPYFSTDKDRFSGSLVLAVRNHESMKFEKLKEIPNLPAVYANAAKDMGFLTMGGGVQFIPIDGQHRIKALKYARDGADEDGKPIPGVDANKDLGQDQIGVILIRFDSITARRIFNKINRYAKPTSRADNLITDDDDAMAVITRQLLGTKGIINSRLVRIEKGNTLAKSAHEFTTLNTLYMANIRLLGPLCISGPGKPSDMDARQRGVALTGLRKEWVGLLSKVDLWKQALANPRAGGDKARQEIREKYLLGKPVGQLALVGGYALALQKDSKIAKKVLYAKINGVDWRLDSDLWQTVLVDPNGNVKYGGTVVSNASKFIAYHLGAPFTKAEKDDLSELIYGEAGHLPKPKINV